MKFQMHATNEIVLLHTHFHWRFIFSVTTTPSGTTSSAATTTAPASTTSKIFGLVPTWIHLRGLWDCLIVF